MSNFFTAKRISRIAIIAALYAALTMALYPISYGEFQCRVSEALTVLPLFFPEAIAGLTIGCLLANLLGNGILDIVFGTLATLLAALTTYFIGKLVKNKALRLVLGELPPILYNAFIVPFTFLAIADLGEFYFINVLWVGLGQLAAIGLIGSALYFTVIKLQERNVALLLNDASEKTSSGTSSDVTNLILTLGIVIPCIGAIICYMTEIAVASYVMLVVAVTVMAIALALKIKQANNK